ncbi:MAG TPA: hypothetical protein VEX87_23800, partial [Skermanella sp.]|nr:hypothetical protein [Skermanella sp.]
ECREMLKNDTVSKDASFYMAILHGRGAMPRIGLNPAKRSTQRHPHKTWKNPKFTGAKKMSLHQTGFQDVLSAAELLGGVLDDILLIGVQAEELEDYGGSLTDSVRAQVEPALAIACRQLADWGYPATPRSGEPAPLLHGGIALGDYEAGRPSPDDACRVGDSRFFG